jgi:hypothetical protein
MTEANKWIARRVLEELFRKGRPPCGDELILRVLVNLPVRALTYDRSTYRRRRR